MAYWPIILICFIVSTVYFWGAVDKLTVDFLSGSRLETLLWLYWSRDAFEITPVIRYSILFLSYGTVILEFLLAFGLWFKKIQIPLIFAAALMHFMMHLWLEVEAFTLIMFWCLYFFYVLIFKTKALNLQAE